METVLPVVPFETDTIVLTVPMRNGNYIMKYIKKDLNEGSYRTYEEWKLHFRPKRYLSLFRSYRTYEEWKQDTGEEGVYRIECSYRTYEEWKQQS